MFATGANALLRVHRSLPLGRLRILVDRAQKDLFELDFTRWGELVLAIVIEEFISSNEWTRSNGMDMHGYVLIE